MENLLQNNEIYVALHLTNGELKKIAKTKRILKKLVMMNRVRKYYHAVHIDYDPLRVEQLVNDCPQLSEKTIINMVRNEALTGVIR